MILFTIALLPVASLLVFLHGLHSWRHGNEIHWQPRLILLAGLTITTTALVGTCTLLYDAFYFLGTHTAGAAEIAICRVNIAHSFAVLKWGVLAGAFCFGLTLLLPTHKKQK
jgi:hypothetical protein